MKKESFNKDWQFENKKSGIKKRVTLPHDAAGRGAQSGL